MNLRTLARKIPDRVRSERLMVPSDPIGSAQPFPADPHFQLLFAIWFEFIEPARKKDADMGCPSCRENILNNFRALKEELVQLEKEYQLLKSL